MLLGYLAFGATLQVLPRWVSHHLGGGSLAVGIAVGVAFGATAVARPFAGRAGDAGVARAAVITGGLLIAAGASGQLLAPNLAVLFAARLVMGLGEAGLFSAALPWVLAGVPAARRASVAGWFGLSMWAGLALGPLVGVVALSVGGLQMAWCTVIALGVFASASAFATPPTQRVRRGRLRPASLRELIPKGAALPGVVFGLGAYGYGAISSGLVLFLSQPGFDAAGAGLAVFAIAFLAARAAGSRLVDQWGGPSVTIVTSFVSASGFILIAAAAKPSLALSGAAVAGFGLSLTLPATVATTLARTSTGSGSAVATATSYWDIGILVAGPATGEIAATAGFAAVFMTAAAASALALLFSFVLLKSSKHMTQSPKRFEPA